MPITRSTSNNTTCPVSIVIPLIRQNVLMIRLHGWPATLPARPRGRSHNQTHAAPDKRPTSARTPAGEGADIDRLWPAPPEWRLDPQRARSLPTPRRSLLDRRLCAAALVAKPLPHVD